jgi:tRNA-splicing ligase RtcB
VKYAARQLGTLGGGNHFIELQRQAGTGRLNVCIHSGSRNVGFQIANYYNRVAKKLNQKWHSDVTGNLYFLPPDTAEYYEYLAAMRWCVQFAKTNRGILLSETLRVIEDVMDNTDGCSRAYTVSVDTKHNWATIENVSGRNVMVHRKGAISAHKGEVGIIPGSQGHPTYMVEGLGNKSSLCSASHGAGRAMSRTEAKKKLNLDEQSKLVSDLNGLTNARLDEAPGAYKNIEEVMEKQTDCVKVLRTFTPICTVKG